MRQRQDHVIGAIHAFDKRIETALRKIKRRTFLQKLFPHYKISPKHDHGCSGSAAQESIYNEF